MKIGQYFISIIANSLGELFLLKPIDDILSVFRLDTPSGPHWAGAGRWWSGWSLRSFVPRSGDCKTNKMRTELRVTVLQKRDFFEKGELSVQKQNNHTTLASVKSNIGTRMYMFASFAENFINSDYFLFSWFSIKYFLKCFADFCHRQMTVYLNSYGDLSQKCHSRFQDFFLEARRCK